MKTDHEIWVEIKRLEEHFCSGMYCRTCIKIKTLNWVRDK